MKPLQRACWGLAVLAVALASPIARAETWPAKPIRLVVPYSPGGLTDVIGRLVAQKLTEGLGQPVVVDNRPGAGSLIGSQLVAKSAPDGYTLLMGSVSNVINHYVYPKVPYDLVRDLEPISQVAKVPNFLAVNPSLPVQSVADVIALVKTKPGAYNFSSPGSGTSPHLSGELFKTMAGVDIQHVPYKGSAPSLADVMAGQVTMTFDNSALPHIKSGKLRGLAVTTSTRSKAAPHLPTLAESGLTGYDVTSWYGLWAPAGTPREIVGKLGAAIIQIMKSPDVGERLAAIGVEPVESTPQQFASYIQSEMAKYEKVVRDSGARVE